MRRLPLALAVCLLLSLSMVLGPPGAPVSSATPVKHIIYIVQENHPFDNYFGTCQGAVGFPAGAHR